MLTVALLMRAMLWKHPRSPTREEWIKEISSCIHIMDFSAIKNEVMSFVG